MNIIFKPRPQYPHFEVFLDEIHVGHLICGNKDYVLLVPKTGKAKVYTEPVQLLREIYGGKHGKR